MKVQHYKEVIPIQVEEMERTVDGLTLRRVISEVDGATNFVMDIFELQPGVVSSMHSHPWEHEGFIIHGQGALVGPDGEAPLNKGDVLFVPAGEPHQICNTGDGSMEFVCVIPQAALTAYYLERIQYHTPFERA